MPFWVIPGKTEGLSNFILGPGARTCLLTLQLAQLPPRFSGDVSCWASLHGGCTGAALGGGVQLCGLLTPSSEHLLGATVSPRAAPTFHVGSGEAGHPRPPPGHAVWVRNTTRLRASWDGVLSTQPPGDGALGTLTGSPLLGLQVVKK